MMDNNEELEENYERDEDDISSDSRDSEEEQEETLTLKQKVLGVLSELVVYAVIIVICLFVVPRYVMQRTIVDGTSMESTLQDTDNLLVDKLTYHFSDPKRFDVIVFYPYGRENKDYYIKRVIGLPGETIQIVGDVIYIDGKVLDEDYGKDPMTQSGIASEPLKLKKDEYFVLGDNRTVSEDSRYEEVGPVSRDKIEGRAVLRIYPFSKFGTVNSLGQEAKVSSPDKGATSEKADAGGLESLGQTVACAASVNTGKDQIMGTSVAASGDRANESKSPEAVEQEQDAPEIMDLATLDRSGLLKKSGEGKMVAIDAGHQQRGDSSTEPVGPGSSVKKAKVAGGATGVSTRVPEYKLTLVIAKKLRKELLERGYEVYMIRTKNDVNISNATRAKMANKSGADIYIRIHADSSGSSSVRGASVLYPSTKNPYVGHLSKKSKRLSECLIKKYCKKTGIRNRGLSLRDDLTGTNWSKIPVSLIEMGFMSNPTEDKLMQNKAFQKKMAAGIADGVDAYFQ